MNNYESHAWAEFTGIGSRVPVTFPYVKPDKPKYQFSPTEEFPNEVL